LINQKNKAQNLCLKQILVNLLSMIIRNLISLLIVRNQK
jgi:hypothetical protein